MFNTIRDLISKRKYERRMAYANLETVNRLATVVDGIRAAFVTWLTAPSSSSSSPSGIDIIIPHLLRGLASGVDVLANIKETKLSRNLEAEMSIGSSVSIIVDADSASEIAERLSELYPQGTVKLEDAAPGKTRLLISTTKVTSGDGDGGSVH
jgi:hypothetical protein